MSYYEQPQSPASWQQNSRPGWDPRSAAANSNTATPSHVSQYAKQDIQGQSADMTTRFTSQVKPEDPAAFGSQLDGMILPILVARYCYRTLQILDSS